MSEPSLIQKKDPFNDSRNPNKAGLVVDSVYPLKIVDKGRKGDGVGYLEGMAIFVKYTEMGDEVFVKVLQIRRNCAIAVKVDKSMGEQLQDAIIRQ